MKADVQPELCAGQKEEIGGIHRLGKLAWKTAFER
jgi:hypothetical protein